MVSYDLNTVESNNDDRAIKYGSERQATLIGRTAGGGYAMLMTLRHMGTQVPASPGSSFDLTTWTRDFSISVDSGHTWSADFFLPPLYEGSTERMDPLSKINKIIKIST